MTTAHHQTGGAAGRKPLGWDARAGEPPKRAAPPAPLRIDDGEAAERIRASWNGVRVLRKKVQTGILVHFASGHGFMSQTLAVAACNLPFLHAYTVLGEALETLAKQLHLDYRGRDLTRLLAASKTRLQWSQFDLINEGQLLSNGVVNEGELLPRSECWKYIEAIDSQLVEWGLIDPSSNG